MPLRVHGLAAQRAAGPPRADHLEGALRERAGRADRNAHEQRLGRLDFDGLRAGRGQAMESLGEPSCVIPARSRSGDYTLRQSSAFGLCGGSRSGKIGPMPFVSGGILAEWGPPKAALHAVQQEIRSFSPKSSDDQYVVDFAFLTWHNFREPDEPYGVKPGPVGRTQRRFIVWHSVPKGLETPRDVRRWLVSVLPKPSDLFGNTCYASQRRIQQRNWPTRWQRSAITSQGTWPDRTTGGRSGCVGPLGVADAAHMASRDAQSAGYRQQVPG